jgi:large subunit ribosomal protein L23
MSKSNNLLLEKPMVTEKAVDKASEGKYTFRVVPKASKPEIKKAIERTFNVRVTKVNVANYKGKERIRGRTRGKTVSWKKAVITLKKGDKIELFEGV